MKPERNSKGRLIILNKIKMWLMVAAVLALITGCSDSEKADTKTDEVSKEEKHTDEKEKVKTVDKKADAPKDQGGYEVWFEGEAERKGKLITVKGKTNLLPESSLVIWLDSVEDTIIGGRGDTQVNKDGTFETELKIPMSSEGLLKVQIKFEPSTDKQPIKDHYGGSGEKLKGPFVRNNEDSGSKQNITQLTLEIPQDESNSAVKIKKPEWEKPEDYGSPTVRIDDPDIQKDERYIYVEGKTNLQEGTRLRGMLDIPGYITSGLQDLVDINPDGSYRMIIENPSAIDEFKDIKHYELLIRMSPGDNSWNSIKDAYGENGEKLQGEFIVEENNSKTAEKKISIVE
jgi:hypothetical protein